MRVGGHGKRIEKLRDGRHTKEPTDTTSNAGKEAQDKNSGNRDVSGTSSDMHIYSTLTHAFKE